MDYQKKYYEFENLWNRKPNEADIERIKKVSELIPPDVSSILDAGCGNGIFINYLKNQPRKFIKIHGVDRSQAALKFVTTEKTEASIEKLPFDEDEFDLVTCLEVLEHLPQPLFIKALVELTRVSKKYIIISVPNNQNLRVGQIICPDCFTLFNPNLHLRSFGVQKLKNLFIQYDFHCKKVEAICQVKSCILSPAYMQWKNKFQSLENRLPYDLICPVCGSTIAGQKNKSENKPENFKNLIRKVWPKIQRKRWLMAIYAKD